MDIQTQGLSNLIYWHLGAIVCLLQVIDEQCKKWLSHFCYYHRQILPMVFKNIQICFHKGFR